MNEIVIGNQTWAANDLQINDGGEGIIIKKYPTRNGIGLGTVYYYNQVALERLANSIPGWRLPSIEEFDTLISYTGHGNYGNGCRLITNPNTARDIIDSSVIPTQFNATMAGAINLKTMDDNSEMYITLNYLEYNGSNMSIRYSRCIGLGGYYWTSYRYYSYNSNRYYCIRPNTENSRGGTVYGYASGDQINTIYCPIRLIKAS